MTTQAAATTCPTCGESKAPEEFYATSVECRSCKRDRSKQNRDAAAQKVALADRLLDVLERLASVGLHPEALFAPSTETQTAPERSNAPRPGSTRQGVNP